MSAEDRLKELEEVAEPIMRYFMALYPTIREKLVCQYARYSEDYMHGVFQHIKGVEAEVERLNAQVRFTENAAKTAEMIRNAFENRCHLAEEQVKAMKAILVRAVDATDPDECQKLAADALREEQK